MQIPRIDRIIAPADRIILLEPLLDIRFDGVVVIGFDVQRFADQRFADFALVDENEVTLKRLRRKGASIALEPANRAYETRIFGPDRVKVQGRMVGLLRKY